MFKKDTTRVQKTDMIFFVYAKDAIFGIDIFTTDRAINIGKNLRHKIERYKNSPTNLDIYFVLIGTYSLDELHKAVSGVPALKAFPNMHTMREVEFLKLMESFSPLSLPRSFVGLNSLYGKT